MVTALTNYREMVRENLRLDQTTEQEVIRELEAHIEDELQELKDAGLSDEEAADTCLTLMGSAKTLAHQICESHSQGSWTQALFTAMPHLLFGLLFALSWWQGIVGLLAALVVLLSVVVYGWWRGKPSWLFSWLGYSLLPVVFAGLLLLYLPTEWAWIAILIVAGLRLYAEEDKAGLVVQLVDAITAADYYRLVPGGRAGGQDARLLAAAPPGFRPLDRADLPLVGGGRHHLYPLEKALAEDIGPGDGRADNPDHDCLLRRWQTQRARLFSSNRSDADSTAKSGFGGTNAKAQRLTFFEAAVTFLAL
ncbi:MAG: permease prefix domain 1-containing protein [Dehalococcoidia bacterium]